MLREVEMDGLCCTVLCLTMWTAGFQCYRDLSGQRNYSKPMVTWEMLPGAHVQKVGRPVSMLLLVVMIVELQIV